LFALLLIVASLTLNSTRILDETLDASASKIIVHEGSTGSGKTVGICQAMLFWSETERNKVFSSVRATMPAAKKGGIRDWVNVLNWATVDGEPAARRFTVNHSDFVWTNKVTGTRVEFFALDGPDGAQKARGPRRDRLWVNEANEIHEEIWRQLLMRTRGQAVMDYNPSMTRSWIYDDVLPRPDVKHIHSTYLDNPYLSAEEVREIEQDIPVYREPGGTLVKDRNLTYTGRGELVAGDPYRWAVFGLGRRGSPSEAIYPILHAGPFPQGIPSAVGIDFGYTNPTVVARTARVDAFPKPRLHVDQLLHESLLTTGDLIARFPQIGVTKEDYIFADSAEPKTIEDIRRAGYWRIKAADKGQGSVYAGIMWLKGHEIILTPRSTRTREEFTDYRWDKRSDGTVSDDPKKASDHAPDAVRYSCDQWRRSSYDYSSP
jgi:phage terminase large subunit